MIADLKYVLYTLGLHNELKRPSEKIPRDLEKEQKLKTDLGDVPNSVVRFGSIFENPFSRFSGQTDFKIKKNITNLCR